jgi:hypothetical protein
MSFFFYTCFSAFSLAYTLLIFSSLIAACRAFATFLALVLAFFLACIAFFVSIRILFNFLNTSFLVAHSCARRTLGVEKSIGCVYSLPKTFSFFL